MHILQVIKGLPYYHLQWQFTAELGDYSVIVAVQPTSTLSYATL